MSSQPLCSLWSSLPDFGGDESRPVYSSWHVRALGKPDSSVSLMMSTFLFLQGKEIEEIRQLIKATPGVSLQKQTRMTALSALAVTRPGRLWPCAVCLSVPLSLRLCLYRWGFSFFTRLPPRSRHNGSAGHSTSPAACLGRECNRTCGQS